MEMQDPQKRLIRTLGERAGLLTLVAFAIGFLAFQHPEQASSQEIEEPQVVTAYIPSSPSPTPESARTPEILSTYKEAEKIEEVTELSSTSTSPTPIPTVSEIPKEKKIIAAISPTPTSTQVPTPTPSPTVAATVEVTNDAVWDNLALCESGGNWAIDTGNGYYGGLQFSQGAWESVGGTGNPAHSSREEQIMRGKMLQEKRGWGAWGMCAVQLGLN